MNKEKNEENIFKKEIFNLRVANACYKNAFDREADRYIREIPKNPPKEEKERIRKEKNDFSTFVLEI